MPYPADRKELRRSTRINVGGNCALEAARIGVGTAWISPSFDQRPFEKIQKSVSLRRRPGVSEAAIWPMMGARIQFFFVHIMSEPISDLPRVRAPDFPAGLDWIQTDGRALSVQDLRGKVVLLDFWTYG